MAHSWLRARPRLRFRLRIVGAAAVAAALGISTYLALATPSREAHETRREIQNEAQQLCGFVHNLDGVLTLALTGPAPTTATGESFRLAFIGLQQSARSVVTSQICRAGISLTPSPPPTPIGSPSR